MPGNIWNKPAVPHVLDDEFESATLDPSWDVGTLDLVTPIDPYAVVATPRVKIHTDARPSWLTVQGNFSASKAYTLPTNFLLWARYAPYIRNATKTNGNYYCSLLITGTDAGSIDGGNQVRLFLRSWGASEGVSFSKSENGGFPTVATIAPVLTRGLAYEYAMLHKIGSSYHAWVMTAGGIRTYLGSTTFTGSGTLDRVAVTMIGNETVPGSPVQGIDFLRVVESATYLP